MVAKNPFADCERNGLRRRWIRGHASSRKARKILEQLEGLILEHLEREVVVVRAELCISGCARYLRLSTPVGASSISTLPRIFTQCFTLKGLFKLPT